MKKLFCLVFLGLLLVGRNASALTFNITYDSSVTSLTNAADVETAFATAARLFQDLYTNSVTVNITMYWGPTGPFTGGVSLGISQFLLADSSYSEIKAALTAHRASAADTNSVASLPPADPIGGPWFVPIADARVLGLFPANDSTQDGAVSFATNVNYTFDPNNRAVLGKYDFIGVAEHEISEVLGRSSAQLDPTFGYLPYDLFRFTNTAARSFDPVATNAYFSVDNGTNVLKFFYTNALFGDIQDWKSSATNDAFDAFTSSGHLSPVSTVDIMALDVLGYNGPGVPAPHLVGTNLSNGNFQIRFVNTPGVSFTVLATTNLSVPLTNWTVLGTATEIPLGQFQFIDTSATGPRRFYEVRSP
jgi:hypothetical protein